MSKVKVDMHTHSEYSPDSRTSLKRQAAAVKAAGLHVVCATDHNTIEGALRLRELADGFRVIVGEEVSSRDGECIDIDPPDAARWRKWSDAEQPASAWYRHNPRMDGAILEWLQRHDHREYAEVLSRVVESVTVRTT